MQAVAKYRNTPIQTETDQGFSVKEKLGIAVVAALGITGIVLLLKKGVTKYIANTSDKRSFKDGTPETIAKQIKMAFENDGYFGTDIKALREIMLRIRSKTELEAIRKEYTKQFGTQLYSDMMKELQTSEYKEMLQIMEGKPEKPGQAITAKQYIAWAKRFKAAFDKTYGPLPGTDEEAIKAVMREIPTQRAFAFVSAYYQKEFGTKLLDDLLKELEFYEQQEFFDTYNAKPKA
jgi:hypothetical protein